MLATAAVTAGLLTAGAVPALAASHPHPTPGIRAGSMTRATLLLPMAPWAPLRCGVVCRPGFLHPVP